MEITTTPDGLYKKSTKTISIKTEIIEQLYHYKVEQHFKLFIQINYRFLKFRTFNFF